MCVRLDLHSNTVHRSESNNGVILSKEDSISLTKMLIGKKSKLKIEFTKILFEADNISREEVFCPTIANF